jgi:membrane protein implicated in regulation of membrane protease activity
LQITISLFVLIALTVFGVDGTLGFSWTLVIANVTILALVLIEVNRRTQAQRKDTENQ